MPTKHLLAAGLLLLACAGARAQDAKPAEEMHDREALRGVEAVRLRVEMEPAGVLPGVTAAHIERGAAERLRSAGLRVLNADEAKGSPGSPTLFYRVTLLTTNCGYVGTAELQLREAVRVTRTPASEATAATWQHVARVHYSSPAARLAEGLVSFVDVFSKEYNAANGR